MLSYNATTVVVRTAARTIAKRQAGSAGVRRNARRTLRQSVGLLESPCYLHRSYATASIKKENGSPASDVAPATATATATDGEVSTKTNKAPTPAPKPTKPKEPLMQRIKHELKHYVNGTKLLGYEIKISTKLLIKFVEGYELSRRETNQLKRTMGDIFRLVPFSAFLIIPFAELLLPVALKIFPNLLPSTYESGKDKQKKSNKLIEIRKKTSDFLHETLEESSLLSYNSIDNADKKKKFFNFFKKLYSPKDGKVNVFTHEEILSVAQMFRNDSVLDNLSRPQLVAMSKFMSITPFGNDNMLRYQIRHKLKQIIEDDKVIDYEGVSTLSVDELYQACVSRGVKAYGVSKEELEENLKVWLDLRLRQKVPSVLLVLSSTFTFGGLERRHEMNQKAYSPRAEEKEAKNRYDELLDLYYDGILQVLSSIPDPVYNVAKLDVAESKSTPTAPEKAEAKEAAEHPLEAAAETVAKSAAEAASFVASTKEAAADVKESVNEKIPVDKETIEKQAEQPPVQPEEEEPIPRTDENEFKLNVLKEQEALIKKEQEEAKARTSAGPISDDINLDEEEKPQTPIPAEQAPETSVTKKD